MDDGGGDQTEEQSVMMKQLQMMNQQMMDLQTQLKQSTDKIDSKLDVVVNNTEKILTGQEVINQILEDSGCKDKAQIKKGFQFLMKKSVDMHVYAKCLYWTLLNYF